MKLYNQSQHTVVLTSSDGRQMACIKPAESVGLEDSLRTTRSVQYFLNQGSVVEIADNLRAPAHIQRTPPPAPQRQVQQVVSLFNEQELAMSRPGSRNTVSAVGEDGLDSYRGPQEGQPLQAPSNIIRQAAPVVIGQQLLKHGKRSVPHNVVVAPDGAAPTQRKASFIRVQGQGGSVALDQGMVRDPFQGTDSGTIQDQSQMLIGSDIPGQGHLVPLQDNVLSQLDQMQGQMNQVWAEHVKQRKYWQIVGSWPLMEDHKKEALLQNLTDPEIILGCAKSERSGEMLMNIASKFKAVTGRDLRLITTPTGEQSVPVHVPKDKRVKGMAAKKLTGAAAKSAAARARREAQQDAGQVDLVRDQHPLQ